MFGYVVVDKPSLRVREFDYYRATYCGLCHAMGKCTGCISRLTLSYDVTFFALVREMLEGTKVEFVKKRCPRHIIKPINTVVILVLSVLTECHTSRYCPLFNIQPKGLLIL